MANTFNLGNGNWAQKTEKVLAYNAENNNYKPLPFDFDRASTATRVNKDGLIETVGIDEPRIDFLNNSKGHLLLEPSRQNSVPYSNDFSQHALTGGSITSDDIVSPDGSINADTFVEDTNNSQHKIREDISVSAGTYTMSVFVKGTDRFISLYPQSAGSAFAVFDIENATITKTGGSDYVDSKIENYGNGWYRCILTYDVSAGTSFLHIYLSDKGTGASAEAPTYTGNGSEMSFYGLQLEQGSYATSYIPTSGQSGGVTRSAETCRNAGNSTVFNDSEGVFYVETEQFADGDFQSVYINLTDASNRGFANSLAIQHRDSGQLRVYAGGSLTPDIQFLEDIDLAQNLKIAIQYKVSDYKLFINGTKYDLYLTPTQPALSNLNIIDFELDNTRPWLGKVKDLRVYKTTLTDAELIALTS